MTRHVFGPPVQLAYAVDDVRRAADRWAARGAGPFFVLDHVALRKARVHGRAGEFDHSSAYAQWGDVMLELICQHDRDPHVGPTSGIHHTAHFVDHIDDAAKALVADGFTEVLHAETATGTTFAMYETTDIGHLIEIYRPTERLRRFYAMVADAASGWDGSDAIRVLG